MLDTIVKAISNLKTEIEKDTFNLTRDDHDAIITQLNSLKDFIAQRYDAHKKSIAPNE